MYSSEAGRERARDRSDLGNGQGWVTAGERGGGGDQRPALVVGLIGAMGEEAAFELIRVLGGARIYVPQIPEEGDALTRLIGVVAATKLAKVYGGERLELPKRNSRRTQILELRRAGESVDGIARQMGCTRRRVFQVLAEARQGRSPTRDPRSTQAAQRSTRTPA